MLELDDTLLELRFNEPEFGTIYVLSLMKPADQVGEFAGWISPPKGGVGVKPGEIEYVRIAT